MKTFALRTISVVALITGWILLHAPARAAQNVPGGAPVAARMPIQQQNELVQKRCAICHSGANPKGGLSLEHFDAGAPDSAVTRIMLIKIQDDGAIFAAGEPVPDEATKERLVSALSAAADSAPADGWRVDLGRDPRGGHNIVTASIQREVPSASDARQSGVYELTITCGGRTQRGEMKLATYLKQGSNAPMTARALFPAKDGSVRFKYKVDRTAAESATLYLAQTNASAPMALVPIPAQTLVIGDLFSDEEVAFPFDRLSPIVRRQLGTCVPSGPAAG